MDGPRQPDDVGPRSVDAVTNRPRDGRTGSGPRQYPQLQVTTPSGACEILLIRHGESEAGIEGEEFATLDGHADPALSPTGRGQAERLASRLAIEHVDAIYVTSLRRTAETARPLSERLDLRPIVEPELREIYLGDWEGWVFRQKMFDGDPDALHVMREQRWDLVPGCEPIDGFYTRVHGAVARLAARHPDQRLVVVTHGAVIAEVLARATGSRPFAFLGADNASISHLIITPQRWIVRRFNDTTHLDERLTVEAAPPM
jgi:probable phosphoglycerate mutase